MKGFIRSLVSVANKPYTDPESGSFDLGYITPSVIVSSGPVSGAIKKWYRYPVEDLVNILHKNHGDNWHIWNLRGEGMGYKESEVNGNVSWFPFPDHQPPSFTIMAACVASIHAFLKSDGERVALIHCKAGKGRSGTICCAYLMYENSMNGAPMSVEDANKVFTSKRMRTGIIDGVTIKSQLRYLGYWYEYLVSSDIQKKNTLLYNRFTIAFSTKINEIRLINAMEFLRNQHNRVPLNMELQGYVGKNYLNNGIKIEGVEIESLYDFDTDPTTTTVEGNDIILTPKEHLILEDMVDLKFSINKVLYLWFNIYFETLKHTDSSVLKPGLENKTSFSFQDFDGFKGSNKTGIQLFESIQFSWTIA